MIARWAIAPLHHPLNRYAVTGGALRRVLVERYPCSSMAARHASFSNGLARNVTTRLAAIGIISAVLGLRPGRGFFSRMVNLPKPESFTSSPAASVLRIWLKKDSTSALLSR